MPCDQIILTHVEFMEKTTDVKLLKKALENLGFAVSETATGLTFRRGYREQGSYNKKSGRLELPNGVDGNSVKVEYSKEVVNDQAEKFGWNVEWDVDEDGNPQADVQKRSW